MKNKLVILTTLLLSFTLSGPTMAKDKDIVVNKEKSELTAIPMSNKQSADGSLQGLDRAQERMSDQGKEHGKGLVKGKNPEQEEDKKAK